MTTQLRLAHLWKRFVWPCVLCASGLAGCSGRTVTSNVTYAIMSRDPVAGPMAFSGHGAPALTPVLRIGGRGQDSTHQLGLVTAIALGQDSSLYVVDTKYQRVAVFDAGGTFRRYIGHAGAGPGAFINPVNVTVAGATIVVYDAAMSRLTVFDTAGTFQRAIPMLGVSIVADIVVESPAQIVLSLNLGAHGLVFSIDEQGRELRSYVRPSGAAQALLARLPIAGRLCMLDSTHVLFANPLTYEMVNVNIATGQVAWAREWRSNIIGVTAATPSGEGHIAPTAALLGLRCDSRHIVFGYLDMRTGAEVYDFFTREGRPSGRLTFVRGASGAYPGFVGALLGDRLATFRSKPFSEVVVFRLDSLASSNPARREAM